MPGVPSGRGCEACRKQKKKCDQGRPSCSRCTRLNLTCVGAGRKRYKFIEQKQNSHDQPISEQARQLMPRLANEASTSYVSSAPTNELSMLLNAFVDTFRPSTDIRFNLVWTYGCFIQEIPSRLGRNAALDAATITLVDAHSIFCSGRAVTPESLIKYSQALKTLRLCLSDPVKAYAPETLCAVMLLLICQSLMKLVESVWTGHTAGMAKIIKARGFYNTQDPFEIKLLLTIRGPVVFEALFNSQIQFTYEEWKCITQNPLDGDTYEGKLMHSLAMVPYFIENHDTMDVDAKNRVVHEIWMSYGQLKIVLRSVKEQLNAMESAVAPEQSELQRSKSRIVHAYLQRGYGLGLAFAIIMNFVLSGAGFDKTKLLSESEHFAEETLLLVIPGKKYSPLGATWIPLCVGLAWIATTKPWLRTALSTELQDLHGYVDGDKSKKLVDCLTWTSHRLRLEKPETPSLSDD